MNDDKIELKFLATKELEKKIERIEGLLAHSKPEITLGEVFEYLCDSELKKLELKKIELKKLGDKKLETRNPKLENPETENPKLKNPEDRNLKALHKIKLRKSMISNKCKIGAPKNNLSQ